MLAVFSAVFGFLAPFLPEVLKFFHRRQEYAQERILMEMRLKHAAAEHAWRLEEIASRAEIAEMQTLRAPQVSFGVQLLDAAREHNMSPLLLGPAFYAFVVLDWISGMVRPTITYAVVLFYIATKTAAYKLLLDAGWGADAALSQLWTEHDWAVLTLVLSFWFGQRVAKAAFGGSASTGRPGGG